MILTSLKFLIFLSIVLIILLGWLSHELITLKIVNMIGWLIAMVLIFQVKEK